MAINSCTFVGRLSRDPELKKTDSGVPYVMFSIAVDRDYVKKGEERICDWIDCIAWRATAEFICKYFRKGNGIGLVGQMQTQSYDKDGEARKSVRLYVDRVSFVEKRQDQTQKTQENEPATDGFTKDDDIPF